MMNKLCVLAVFLAFVVCARAAGGCPSGWETYGSSCYFFSNKQKIFQEARDDCVGLGAAMLIIDDAAENQFVEQELVKRQKASSWIGLEYQATTSQFEKIDGGPSSYLNWAPGQPGSSISSGDVVEIKKSSGQWDRISRTSTAYYICEKSSFGV